MYEGEGTYHHYKGGEYEVIGLAIREETKEEGWVKEVIYRPISPGSLLESIDDVMYWSRQLDDFNKEVPSEKYGHVPRFVKVAD